MNKHLKIAIIMAPILMLISYAVTGYFYSQPQLTSGTYQLHLKHTCNPDNNACHLSSGKIKVNLISANKKNKKQLAVLINEPIEVLSMALAKADQEYTQMPLVKLNQGKYWHINLASKQVLDSFSHFRLALSVDQTQYFYQGVLSFNGN